jgi:hypothetical protein
MKARIIAYCNGVHMQWDVSTVSEKPLLEALNTMAGEPIPDWLPVQVRFEAEDGEMVMKLDYQNKTGSYQERFDLGDHPPKRVLERDLNVFMQEAGNDGNNGMPELLDRSVRPRTAGDYMEEVLRTVKWRPRNVADFVHATGRNMCSTSGWGPRYEDTQSDSTVLVDSTHTASAFSNKSTPPDIGYLDDGKPLEYIDRHPCVASTFCSQKSTWLGATPKHVCLSPAWSSSRTMTTTFNLRQEHANPTTSSNGSEYLTPLSNSSEYLTPSSRDSADTE